MRNFLSMFGYLALRSLLIAMLIATPLMTTGCSQAQVTKAVQNAVNVLTDVQAQIPAAKSFGETVATLDPEAGALILKYVASLDNDLTAALKLGNGYLSAPGGTGFQAFLNAADALTNTLDAQILDVFRVSNSDTQAKVRFASRAIVTLLHTADGILVAVASSAQKNALPKTASVSFDKVRPFLDRQLAHDRLDAMGYNADRALQAFGL